MAARLTQKGDPPPAHGTYSRYNHWKCRCDECKAANRIRQRIYRTGDATRGMKAAHHGSRSMYVHRHCRCGLCKDANRIYQRERKKAKRSQ